MLTEIIEMRVCVLLGLETAWDTESVTYKTWDHLSLAVASLLSSIGLGLSYTPVFPDTQVMRVKSNTDLPSACM